MTPSEKPLPDPQDGPDRTQKLVLPPVGDAPGQTLKIARPPEEAPASRPSGAPRRPSSGSWKLSLIFGAVVVVGAVLYLVSSRGPVAAHHEGPAKAAEEVPPGAQAYLEQAQAGDAHAMRMLGVMYYYGLNVPQDREKGLLWYRKAAERGSEAAKAELSKLEGKG